MIKLIVGLGNPGNEYARTRHNIGWMVIDQFNLNWQKKFKGLYQIETHHGEKLYFLKPQTYMNLSGESVVELMNFFKIKIEEVLVVHDELDHAFGQVSLKKGGGLAGHNGLKSIAEMTGSQEFYRIRLGIGRPVHGSVADYVLGEFSSEEKKCIDTYLTKAKETVDVVISDGFDKAAQTYSKKVLI